MSYFSGKCVLVTGAASGIGEATVKSFLKSGATVVGYDLRKIDPDSFVAFDRTRLRTEQVDITVEQQVVQTVSETLARFKAIDVLVNCAGVGLTKPLFATSLEDFERVMAVNVRGMFLMGRAVINGMKNRNAGRVINVASELGLLGRENSSVYCASKGAVISMTRSWAREFAPDILVNAIAPGPIDTPLLGIDTMAPESVKRELSIPMKRIGHPDEIARAINFLAGPGATFMTGQTVGVDGGAAMY